VLAYRLHSRSIGKPPRQPDEEKPMAHLRAVTTSRSREASIRELLYKTDHPRRIDAYIDFFGDRAVELAVSADPCGELLLGSLA
jgi:hypothetical protein